MRVLRHVAVPLRPVGARAVSSTRAGAVARGTLKYAAVVGVSGYLGYSLARQLVAPIPVPLTSDLPESEIRAIRKWTSFPRSLVQRVLTVLQCTAWRRR